MRNVIAACLLVLFVCAGCGNQKYWYNKQSSYAQVRSDCWDCISQVQTQNMVSEDEDVKSESELQKLIVKCMNEKGYKATWDYKIDYHIRKGFVSYGKSMYPVAGK